MKLLIVISSLLALFSSCVPEQEKDSAKNQIKQVIEESFTLQKVASDTTLYNILDLNSALEDIFQLTKDGNQDEALKSIAELEELVESFPINCSLLQFQTPSSNNSSTFLFESEIMVGEKYRINIAQNIPQTPDTNILDNPQIQAAYEATLERLLRLKAHQVCSNSGTCEISENERLVYDSKTDEIITTKDRIVTIPISTRMFAGKGSALDSETSEFVINNDHKLEEFKIRSTLNGLCSQIIDNIN